jgi:hypothetical protein
MDRMVVSPLREIAGLKRELEWRCLKCKLINKITPIECEEGDHACHNCGAVHRLFLHVSILVKQLVGGTYEKEN